MRRSAAARRSAGSGLAHLYRNTLAIGAGLALGLFSSWLALERGHGFGAITAGPWTGWPRTGADDADPYARAVAARTGELALGSAEGLTFLARGDSAGRTFDRRCDYTIHSPVPVARFWTLSILDQHGQTIAGGQRQGFTSGEIIRFAPGPFTITVSREVRPGNWLPVSGDGGFELMLRLYDTPLSANAQSIGEGAMPRIERGECRT
ncbi:MAG: DUF1214 domain-containing protein [Alphaproteobacteria bacterium]|nr:DUF1214 domain-containing protein [Alphaproteobacteria bacterium]